MADTDTERLLSLLRHRLNRFLSSGSGQVTSRALQEVMRLGHPAFLFGSVIRNLLISRPRPAVRDVDIVVDGLSTTDLLSFFNARPTRTTRFGGLHVEVEGVPFDIWPISETWAFRQRDVGGRSFADLPKTTFLNVEAVTAELSTTQGRPRKIYSNGFFEALTSRCLDINFEDNPYPKLCVVRSLITAVRLRFAISPRLARYILHYAGHITLEELAEEARFHYPRYSCQLTDLHSWINALRQQLRISRIRPVSLSAIGSRKRLLGLCRPHVTSRVNQE